jgi:Putative zinc ribbon domain
MTLESAAGACVSCGMPMRTDVEHAASDATKPYCVHCGRDDGELRSYEEVLGGFTGFLRRTQGLSEDAARQTATRILANQPAWAAR